MTKSNKEIKLHLYSTNSCIFKLTSFIVLFQTLHKKEAVKNREGLIEDSEGLKTDLKSKEHTNFNL